jgi:hypothetical protein
MLDGPSQGRNRLFIHVRILLTVEYLEHRDIIVLAGFVVAATAFALMTLGGGLYEYLVVDPAWPKRPDVIQPARGGIEKAATVDEAAARRWTRLSRLRFPIEVLTCYFMLNALWVVWR